MSNKTFREMAEEIHSEIWQETVNRFDLRTEDPEGMLIANVMSYRDGYVTTVAQAHIDPSDMTNIGIELMASGVVQLIQKLLTAQENTDNEEFKELTPLDICEAGIEKATDQLRRRVRRVVTDMLQGNETEGRDVRSVPMDADGKDLPSDIPTDGPVQ